MCVKGTDENDWPNALACYVRICSYSRFRAGGPLPYCLENVLSRKYVMNGRRFNYLEAREARLSSQPILFSKS